MDVELDEATSTTVLRAAGREQQPADSETSKWRPEDLKYLDPRTETAITDVLEQALYPKTGGAQCFLCGFVATCQNRLRLHTRQHYTNHVCGCGESSFRRDWVLEHIRKEKTSATFGTRPCRPGLVYEVDRPSFARFVNETQNPIREFLPVRTTDPDTRHQPVAPPTKDTTPGGEQQGPIPSAFPRFSPARKDDRRERDEPRQDEPRQKTRHETEVIERARRAEGERRRAERHQKERAEVRQAQRERQREERRLRRRAVRAKEREAVERAEEDAKATKPRKSGPRTEDKPRTTPSERAQHRGTDREAPRHRDRASHSQHQRPKPRSTAPDLRGTIHQRQQQRVGSVHHPSASALPSTHPVGPAAKSYAETARPAKPSVASTSVPAITPSMPSASTTLGETMLRLETQAQDLFRFIARHHPHQELAEKADALAQATTEARRQAATRPNTSHATNTQGRPAQHKEEEDTTKRMQLLRRNMRAAYDSLEQKPAAE